MKNVKYENKVEPITLTTDPYLSPLPHLHKEIEIVYVIRGTASAFADQKQYTLRAGDFFFCSPNQIHFYEHSEIGSYQVIIVSTDVFFGLKKLLSSHVPENNVLHLQKDSPACDCLTRLTQLQPQYGASEAVGYLNLLMSRVLPQLTLTPLITSNNTTLHRILDFCLHRFTGDLSLDLAASELHLNKYYISHLLNEKINLSFSSYINTLRVSMACDLLHETDHKIADISEEVGFGTIRSFNRAFLQIMHTTPISYRDALLEKSNDT